MLGSGFRRTPVSYAVLCQETGIKANPRRSLRGGPAAGRQARAARALQARGDALRVEVQEVLCREHLAGVVTKGHQQHAARDDAGRRQQDGARHLCGAVRRAVERGGNRRGSRAGCCGGCRGLRTQPLTAAAAARAAAGNKTSVSGWWRARAHLLLEHERRENHVGHKLDAADSRQQRLRSVACVAVGFVWAESVQAPLMGLLPRPMPPGSNRALAGSVPHF